MFIVIDFIYSIKDVYILFIELIYFNSTKFVIKYTTNTI